jgi:D-beta-D-heptose 7-phosphate kinase/D-beta-D-heptose 1-phosphate adenosyltransferase
MSKILVIGESAVDHYIFVEPVKICPEAPALVVRPVGEKMADGMAANVYNNLISLGISKSNVETIFPRVDIIKKRFVDKQSGVLLLRLDEDDGIINRYKAQFRREDFDELITNTNYVLISSYNKGFLTTEDIKYIADKSVERGIKVFYDGKFILNEWARNIYCVKINNSEYKDQIKAGIKPEDFCQNLIKTDGPNGCEITNLGIKIPTDLVDVQDVTGAGDSFISALVKYFCHKGENLIRACEYANRVAGVCVGKRGTYAVKEDEVLT